MQIMIRGRQYTVRSDEPEEDIELVARMVDRKMSELARPSFDEYTIALLTAMNIASEFHRFRQTIAGRLQELDREAAAISAVIDAALPESE